MGKVYAIANQKGGSGKTTTTENLAAALALEGKRVLVIDYDPQCSLTCALEHDDEAELCEGVGSGYDMVPGDPSLVVRDFGGVDDFHEDIERYRPHYDYILLDCPPSLSMVTMNALFPADHIIIPTQASYLAAVGIGELVDMVGTLRKHGAPAKDIKVLITMYERNGSTKEMEDQIRGVWPTFDTMIRKNVACSYAQARTMDVFEYDRNCNGAKDYQALSHELINS